MKVLVIGYTHSKHDKRVFRTVQAFSKEHEVVYQYLTDKNETPYREGNVLYIPVYYGKIGQKWRLSEFVKEIPKRRRFDKSILTLIERSDCDLVYFHDFLATAPVAAFKVAKTAKKKVAFDIHEYYPEDFLSLLRGFLGELKQSIMWRIFKKQLELADKLIFVSEEIRKDVLDIVGFQKPSLVVPNYAPYSLVPTEKRKEIVHVGVHTRVLFKEKLILRELVNRGIKFRLIGIKPSQFQDIPHEYVDFLPYEKMMQELSKAMFSLISYDPPGNDLKNYIFALPNKFFDSIAAGTPVIVRNTFISMCKEVEKYGVGVIIDPNDVEGSVRKILSAFENYDFYRRNVEKHKEHFVWNEEKEHEFLNFVFDD